MGGISKIEKKKMEGEVWFGKLMKRDREDQRKERWDKIKESRYNEWYKEVKGKRVLEYLKRG